MGFIRPPGVPVTVAKAWPSPHIGVISIGFIEIADIRSIAGGRVEVVVFPALLSVLYRKDQINLHHDQRESS